MNFYFRHLLDEPLLEERLQGGPLDDVIEDWIHHVFDEEGFDLREAKSGLLLDDFEERGAGDLFGYVF